MNISDDTQLTPNQHLNRQSVKIPLIFTKHQVSIDTWVSQHSANYQPTVNQVSIELQSSGDWVSTELLIKCHELRCWWDVDLELIKSIHWHSTWDGFSMCDPETLEKKGLLFKK